MKFFVDTREKKKTLKLLRKMKLKFTLKTMDAGDYETDQCCAERKTVKDLVGSIKGTKAKPGRFFVQMRKLAEYCKEEGKIPFLFVSGSLKEEADWYDSRGWKLNLKSVMGAMASASVRYGINVFAQFSDDEELFYCMHSVFEKVKEGKHMLPHRAQLMRGLDAKTSLWCTVLRIQPRIARVLIKKYGALAKFLEILKKRPSQLEYIHGVGPGTVKKWKILLE